MNGQLNQPGLENLSRARDFLFHSFAIELLIQRTKFRWGFKHTDVPEYDFSGILCLDCNPPLLAHLPKYASLKSALSQEFPCFLLHD